MPSSKPTFTATNSAPCSASHERPKFEPSKSNSYSESAVNMSLLRNLASYSLRRVSLIRWSRFPLPPSVLLPPTIRHTRTTASTCDYWVGLPLYLGAGEIDVDSWWVLVLITIMIFCPRNADSKLEPSALEYMPISFTQVGGSYCLVWSVCYPTQRTSHLLFPHHRHR